MNLLKHIIKKSIPPMFFILFSSLNIFSADWFSFDDNETYSKTSDQYPMPKMQQSDFGINGFDVNYTFPGAIRTTKHANNKEYTLLKVDNFGYLDALGKPALPYRIYTFAVPENAKASVIINSIENSIKEDILIYPALPAASDKVGAPEPKFTIDENFYKSDVLYPEKAVSLIDIRTYRGVNLARVRVCPIQYNPAKKTLLVHSNINFSVKFDGATDNIRVSKKENSILENVIVNNKITSQDRSIDAESNGKLLIITSNEFKESADSLAFWKRAMGYDVFVSSKASWNGYTEVQDTAHYYGNSENIDFLTIIGDHDDVPSYFSTLGSYDHVTDLYFACLDGAGDMVPDFAHGRISVSNASEAMNTVLKIINYERNPVTDPTFYQNGISAAYFQHASGGYAERRFAQTSWEIRGYLINEQAYSIDRAFYTSSSTNPQYWNDGYYSSGEALPDSLQKPNYAWNGNSTQISNALNDGRFMLFHRDHGEEVGWGDPHYNISNINTLTNGNETPIVFSINCLTGKFNYSSNCFAEAFLRHSNGGAAGVVAATEISYSGCNDGLAEGLIDAIWPNPGLVPLFPHNTNPTVTPHEPITEMGNVLIQGKLRMSETWHSGNPPFDNEKYTYELFHYFGDASTRIWTQEPVTISASHSSALLLGQANFSISNISNPTGIATIIFNNEVIGRAEIIDGNVNIPINILPEITGDALITITGYNVRPYQVTIPVIPGGPTIIPSSPIASSLYDVGEDINIEWQTFVPESIPAVSIFFSSDSGITFASIATDIANSNQFTHTAPAVESDECIYRIETPEGNYGALTPAFSIHNLSTISGFISSNIEGTIQYSGPQSGEIQTNDAGRFSLARLLPGTYEITASVSTDAIYNSTTQTVVVPPNQLNLEFNIEYPTLSVSVNNMEDTLFSGDSSNTSFTISNTGDGILHCNLNGGGGNGSILINEVCSNPDIIEIWNTSNEQDISNWQLSWVDNTSSSASFTFPSGTTIPQGGRIVVHEETGTGNDSLFFTGASIGWVSSSIISVALVNDSGSGIDFMKTESSTTVPPAPTVWTGPGISRTLDAIYRNSDMDNDTESDWSNGTTPTSGTANPGQGDNPTPSWYSLSPDSAEFTAGSSSSISVQFNATGLLGGIYRDTLDIFHDDPSQNNPKSIPVTLTVQGIKRLSIDTTSLTYGNQWVGDTIIQSLEFVNNGTDTTSINSADFLQQSFNIGATFPVKVPPQSYTVVPVIFHPEVVGTVNDTVTFHSDASDNSEIIIALSGTGTTPPALSVSPLYLADTLDSGDSTLKEIYISNTGGDILSYTISEQYNALVYRDSPISPAGEIKDSSDGNLNPDVFIPEIFENTEAVSYPFFDSFEDSTFSNWSLVSTTITRTIDTTSSHGQFSLRQNGGSSGHRNGSMLTFDTTISPEFISFSIRSSSTSNSDGYFVLGAQDACPIFFYAKSNGCFYANEDSDFNYESNRWYDILIQIDWSSHSFNLFVNDSLVFNNQGFRDNVNSISNVHLYNYTSNSTAWYDNIQISDLNTSQWLSLNSKEGQIAPNQTDTIDVTIKSESLAAGLHLSNINVSSNAPLQGTASIPCSLTVNGMKRLTLSEQILDYGTIWNFRDSIKVLTLINEGNDTTSISSISINSSIFRTNASLPLSVPPFQSRIIGVAYSPMSTGVDTALVTITSNAEDNPTLIAHLTGSSIKGPEISISALSLNDTVTIGDSSLTELTITNSGDVSLNYSIQIDDNADNTDASGGPDDYGYRWRDSDQPNSINFIWQDISGTGSVLSISSSDDSYEAVNLSYAFPFYGVDYTTIYVGTNGFITFETGNSSLSNTAIPSTSTPNGLIAALWDDLDPGNGGNIYFQDFSSYSIVQFDSVRHNSASGTYTFQYVLHNNGRIEIFYKDIETCNLTSASVGIEDQQATTGLQVVYNNSYLHDSLALEFYGGTKWLSSNITSGTIAPQSNATIQVKMNSADLDTGFYSGNLTFTSNDAKNNTPVVLCSLLVKDIPLPIVSFSTTDTIIQEAQGSASISFQLSFPTIRDISIPYNVSGTAFGIIDHHLVNGTAFIPAGVTDVNIPFNVVSDNVNEDNESIIITMGAPVNAISSSNNIDTLIIVDDEHLLNLVSLGNGTVSPLGNSIITENVPFPINAIADNGYVFNGWNVLLGTVQIDNIQSPVTNVTVNNGDATIAANFSLGASISIDSINDSAEVFLTSAGSWGGTKKLTGPGIISGLNTGTHRITVKCIGYRTESIPVTVAANDTTHINVDLRPLAAIIMSKPDTIKVEGVPIQVGSMVSAVKTDIDNDNDIDIVSSNSLGDVELYLNNGGSYSSPVLLFSTSYTITTIRVADYDDDMVKDILISSNNGLLYWYKGLYNNTFGSGTLLTSNSQGISSFETIDLSNDGTMDFIISRNDGALTALVNVGSSFSQDALIDENAAPIVTSPSAGITLLDVSGDAKEDIILSNETGAVNWYLANENGSYTNKGALNCNGLPMLLSGPSSISIHRPLKGDFPSLLISDSHGALFSFPGHLRGDLNNDGVVDVLDLQLFGINWGKVDSDINWLYEPNLNVEVDIFSGKQTINALDLQLLGNSWGNMK